MSKYPYAAIPVLSGVCLIRTPLRLESPLGHGTFGVVYSAKNTRADALRAVKVLKMTRRAVHEFRIHSKLRSHPGVVKLYAAYRWEKLLFLEMDLCSGGTLAEYMSRASYWRETALLKNHLFQLVDAVQFCHQQGVFHCDIKPQ
jgi:serine/threonine protein kinase